VANFGDQELNIEILKDGGHLATHQIPQIMSFSVKLLAVNDSKSKLIGLLQIKVNFSKFEPIVRKQATFDKCIDKEGSMTYSAFLNGTVPSQFSASNNMSVLQRSEAAEQSIMSGLGGADSGLKSGTAASA
jgi:hypothetical protein